MDKRCRVDIVVVVGDAQVVALVVSVESTGQEEHTGNSDVAAGVQSIAAPVEALAAGHNKDSSLVAESNSLGLQSQCQQQHLEPTFQELHRAATKERLLVE